jgi:hypothetical protein
MAGKIIFVNYRRNDSPGTAGHLSERLIKTFGRNGDLVAPGERCASTTNRNFRGRQGPGARTPSGPGLGPDAADATVQAEAGEPGGARTHDHLIKSQVLYQLSYGLFRALLRALRTPVKTAPQCARIATAGRLEPLGR